VTLNASSAQLTDGGATSYGVGATYAAGNLTVGAGYGIVEGGTLGVKFYDTARTVGADTIAAGGYSANLSDASVTDATVSATYVMGDTTLKGIYQLKTLEASSDAVSSSGSTVATYVHAHAAIDVSATVTSMGVSVSHKIGAISLAAYGISSELDGDTLSTETATVSRYGIGATYDLGGGATIGGGWAAVDEAVLTPVANTTAGTVVKNNVTSDTINKFDVGVNFSF
jgi:outer membrane protein OmpU